MHGFANHTDQRKSDQVKDIIQDLFQVMVQVSAYDSAGRPSKEVLANELYAFPKII